MDEAVQTISWQGLVVASIPTLLVIALMWRWAAGAGTAVYASLRMLVQLLLIGYVLVYIFETGEPGIVMAVLAIMLVAASWISIRPLADKSRRAYRDAFIAIAVSGLLVLGLVSQVVIGIEPWFSPRYLVPLAGMIFSGAMNTVSLAGERAWAEASRGVGFVETRRIAMQAALIPMINSLFAVGLVALPGMMTGQILSGVSPVIAAKYQIVVMLMLFGVTGLAAAIFVSLQRESLESLSAESRQ
ncbi:MAG: ABC transporter permease [Gammaproteobacteria bacterium]|nr:ABC transporter permease [Gammaproteobacteria bacterium]NNF50250.1 ABC transporter permease [Woeseiaceae bacterium]MBT8095212.1 ABC transporter permease [Gammaproteobacteria bacterium]MBT8105370.1 ABC transporter permease [Gammaproteobacteria bacterium]NNK25384.1 ABC transporter permease [Woeseiaceae bacterium]